MDPRFLMEHDPMYQPDDEPLDERLPLLCDACGALVPDGEGINGEVLLCEKCFGLLELEAYQDGTA